MARWPRRTAGTIGSICAGTFVRRLVVGRVVDLYSDRGGQRDDAATPKMALVRGADLGASVAPSHGNSSLSEEHRKTAERASGRRLQSRRLCRCDRAGGGIAR